ncbi:MAG TPA: PilZ domain-containing protein [Nitrospirales bacterium]|nr:PilZ domain-containing protein [Nitrospirales bacterium]
MALPHCPKCGKNLVQQSPRQGIIEALWGFFSIYPFRCQLCTHRFLAFQWWWRRFFNYYGRREYVRIPVRFQLTFSGKQVSGEGTVVNLSRQGCTIETDTPIPIGELVFLRVREPDSQPLFEIEAAVVRTMVGKLVGVEFVRIQERELERLERVIVILCTGHPI